MKKVENYARCIRVLETATRKDADDNELMRMGIVCQYNLSFELAWKALQGVLDAYYPVHIGGSPREVLAQAYKEGLIDDQKAWLEMLKARNESIHIYDVERVELLLDKIFATFIPTMKGLAEKLRLVVMANENRE